MSSSLPKLLITVLITSCLSGCGDEPAPAPVAAPEEFDDPFAEEDDPAEEAATPGDEPALAAVDPALAAAGDSDTPAAPGADGLTAEAEQGESESEGASAAEPGSVSDGAAATVDGEAKARSADDPSPAPTPKSKAATSPKSAPPADKPASAPTEPAVVDEAPAAQPSTQPSTQPTTQPKTPAETKPAPPIVKEPPAPPPEARFVGAYRYAGGSAQRQRLKDAIDTAVQQLNAVIRGIGRRRLNESNQVRDQIDIAVSGDRVTTKFTPGGTFAATLGAAAIPWTTDTGNAVKGKVKLVKGRLVQEFQADDGARRNVFTLNPSGDTLTLSVTISSDRLPEPVKYALTYKRK